LASPAVAPPVPLSVPPPEPPAPPVPPLPALASVPALAAEPDLPLVLPARPLPRPLPPLEDVAPETPSGASSRLLLPEHAGSASSALVTHATRQLRLGFTLIRLLRCAERLAQDGAPLPETQAKQEASVERLGQVPL